jgi:hypothetical protein
MKAAKMMFIGMPTNIEIKALNERWPESEMESGDVFSYEDVASTIGADPGSFRFKTVTSRWRSIVERNTGKRIGTDKAGHFKVLTDSEKLMAIESKRRSISRQGRKNLVRVSYVDRKKLSGDERARLDHVMLAEGNALAASQLRKRIELPEM